jgi:hypothetical protein
VDTREETADDPLTSALLPLRALGDRFSAGVRESPLESLCALVGVASVLFYWAEQEQNDKVNDYWDAVHYVATSLSVGYANIFPVTPLGKAIGAVVMMVGPALSSRALDARGNGEEGSDDGEIVAKLDEILVELRRLGGRA